MLSGRSSVDIHALKRQGMTISEIARRTGHDRKTIRSYLNGERVPGVRRRSEPDAFDPFVDYARDASTTTRTSGSQRCWTSCVLSGSPGPIRRWADRSVIAVFGRRVWNARTSRSDRTRSSSTLPERRRSSTGSSCLTRQRDGGSKR